MKVITFGFVLGLCVGFMTIKCLVSVIRSINVIRLEKGKKVVNFEVHNMLSYKIMRACHMTKLFHSLVFQLLLLFFKIILLLLSVLVLFFCIMISTSEYGVIFETSIFHS